VICGTRKWSQEVDVASTAKVSGKNIAYAVHFYASSHGEWLREKVRKALNNGAAIFATEWGTCEANGNGALRLDEARAWMGFFEYHGISDANWAVSDKDESCSALRQGASASGNWGYSHLTQSGRFVRDSIRGHAHTGSCSAAHENCRATSCCSKPGWTCFEKNAEWASCRPSCNPGIDPTDHPDYLTPWTCKVLSTTKTFIRRYSESNQTGTIKRRINHVQVPTFSPSSNWWLGASGMAFTVPLLFLVQQAAKRQRRSKAAADSDETTLLTA